MAATPLEQFQILPLSAQVYPAAATLTSLEEANLFPQLVGTDLVYATSSCAGSEVTSWNHHAWFDLYSAVPSYLYSATAASTNNGVAWGALEAGFANPGSLSIQWYEFTSFLTLPVAYLIYMIASGALWAYFYSRSGTLGGCCIYCFLYLFLVTIT